MTDPALFDLIDRYGGVLAVWPDEARARAEAAALSDPAFAAALDEARRLDAALDALSAPEPLPPGYATRIAARAVEAADRLPAWLRPRIAVPLGALIAASASVAGAFAANVLAVVDPDLLSLAELALGAGAIVTGN